MNRQDHINQLARELNCRLEIDPKFRTAGMMYVELGYVEVPPVENQIDYLINLHELGRFALGHTQARDPHPDKRFYFDNGVLKSEAQAWEWALNQCLDPIEDVSRYFMWDSCLATYYLWGYLQAAGKPDRILNGNRGHIQFVYDDPDEYFTSIVERIQGGLNGFKIGYRGKVEFG